MSCAAAVLSACGSTSTLQPPTPLVQISNPIDVTRVWALKDGQGIGSNYLKLGPVVADGRGFITDDTGELRAFDVKDGSTLWHTKLHLPVTGGVGYADQRVLVGTRRARVLALDPKTGKVLWQTTVSSEVLSPPRGSDGVVVVRTIDGRLFGLDAADGHLLWTYDRGVPVLTLRGTSAPVISNGIVIAGFDSGKLAALTLKDGTVLWEADVAIPHGRTELERMVDIDGDPVVVGDTIYVASYQGRVAAVQLDSGRLLWARDVSSYAGIAVDDKKVYVSDATGQVWALDRYSGATLWKQDKLLHRYLTAPAVYGAYVVVGDLDGYLHWMSRDDGRLVARIRISEPDDVFALLEPSTGDDRYVERRDVLAPPVVADNLLMAVDRRGVLAAYRVAAK